MLKNLYEVGCFDYKKFILDNLKKLSLSPSEAVVLICLLDETKEKGQFSISNMERMILLKRSEIENILGQLLERGFYSIYLSKDNGLDEEHIALDGFFLKASHILQHDDSKKDDELYKVTVFMEETLNRVLTSSELDILTSLVLEDYYVLSHFEASAKKLEKRKNITFKLIVSNLSSNNEDKKETPQYVTDFINKLKKHD